MTWLLTAAGSSASAQNVMKLEVGTSYTIVSSAEANTSLSYQWYRNGSAISGATGTSYTVPTEEAYGSNVEFKRASYIEGCPERKFSNAAIITWCNLLINGVCWADANVTQPGAFAPRPDMHTEFYQWNQPNVPWPATGGLPAGTTWATDITAPAWTATPCPEGWRLPTYAEIQALQDLPGDISDKRGYWAAGGARGNTMAGRFYGITAARGQAGGCALPDDMVGCIFLPASGRRNNAAGGLDSQNAYGNYWSSTQGNATLGHRLGFTNTGHDIGANGKAYGFNVRCVQ